MKRLLLVLSSVLILVALAACSDRRNASDNNVSSSSAELFVNSADSNPDTEIIEESELSETQEAESPSEAPWSPNNYPDPTLRENMGGPYYRWEHLEYKAFGDFSEFSVKDGIVPNYETYEDDTDFLYKFTMKIPNIYYFENSDILYDAGFKNADLGAGNVVYPYDEYLLYDEDETFLEAAFRVTAQYSADVMLGDGSYNWIESSENQPGSYTVAVKFVRCVYQYQTANNELIYLLQADDSTQLLVSFIVSENAAPEDLRVYDLMVESLKVTEKA